MKTIMLTSSGFLRRAIREEILQVLPAERSLRVAYIPTASKVVKDDSYALKDVAIMQDLRFEVDEIDIAEVKHGELAARCLDKDFIYVQGGNPYWLLRQVRESGFDEIVPHLIEAGIPYIGKSAGAYILAPEVIVPEWLGGDWRRFDVADVTGIGLVPFVWAAHYEDSYLPKLSKASQGYGYPVRAITNDQAFLIQEGKTRLVGIGEEIVI